MEPEAASGVAHDEVDHIIEGWHRARPGLDVAPLAVFSRIGRIARMLDLARRSALAAHELETWSFDVLTALRRAEGAEGSEGAGGPGGAMPTGDGGEAGDGSAAASGLTPGTLMAESLVSSGTMTNRLQRLEQNGLVTRETDPRDRRVVRVHLTGEGRKRVDAALDHLLHDEERLLAEMSAAERQQLAGLLRQLLTPLEDLRN